ncbi:MAG: hypothetical protein AABP62_28935 [Planctomycetota bacterium]
MVWYFEATKPFVDHYANHSSLFGLLLSVVGFGVTVWTVFETLRVNAKSQEELQTQIQAARQETKALLSRIQLKSMGDLCEHAFYLATEARIAIRSETWHRVVDICDRARQHALQILDYDDLNDSERIPIRATVEDLKTVVNFVEKYRLKANPPKGLPREKVAVIDSYIDTLQRIRSWLHKRVMENSNVN